jgi:hypothetical protein
MPQHGVIITYAHHTHHLCSGQTYSSFTKVADQLGLVTCRKSHFCHIQRSLLVPIVSRYFNEERVKVIEEINNRGWFFTRCYIHNYLFAYILHQCILCQDFPFTQCMRFYIHLFICLGGDVNLAGDGRFDSPGYCARHCSYTFEDTVRKL